MTARPSIDSEDGSRHPRVDLTQVSTGVSDCLRMGFVDPSPGMPRTRPDARCDLIGA